MKIALINNFDEWKNIFENESLMIKNIFNKEIHKIEHIGSTSMSNLPSKNIVDILIVLDDIKLVIKYLSQLHNIGYKIQKEWFPLCYYFKKKTDDTEIHVHICDVHNNFYIQNICFRDYLLENPKTCNEYGQTKIKLANVQNSACKKNSNYFSFYTLSKNAFIKTILKKTNFNELLVNFCIHDEEWEYFSNQIDNNLDIQKDNNTFCFVLYKGVEIIGCAKIKILPNSEKILDMKITQKDENQEIYEKYLLNFLNQWIQNFKQRLLLEI